MSGLRTDEAAVSEIVGALLLVLVVSSAAIAFGVFFQQQQKEAQKLEALEADRKAESLVVRAIAPTDAGLDLDWDQLRFTLTNANTKEVNVHQVRLNDGLVKRVWLDPSNPTDCTTGTEILFDGDDLTTQPDRVTFMALQQVVLCLNAATAADFYTLPATLSTAMAVEVELATERGNSFERAFIPPSAVIIVAIQGSTPSYILDGGSSATPNLNGFLLGWSWTVERNGASCDAGAKAGRLYQTSCDLAVAGDYEIGLTVRDNFGMLGTATLTFTV